MNEPTRGVRWGLAVALAVASLLCKAEELAPKVDHHQHLLSPQGAALLNNPAKAVDLPAGVADILRQHEAAWNDPARLAAIYSADAVVLNVDDDDWIRGAQEVAAYVGTRFARPYQITPVAYTGDEQRAHLAALYSRGEGIERRHIGYTMIELVRAGEQWRVATEYPIFPGPTRQEPLDAQRLVAMLDAAHIQRAVVLSVGYWFDSPNRPLARSADAVKAENTWTADEVARFADRLVAFCSLNPVSDAAPEIMRQCTSDKRFKGLKLHFANSQVDLLNPDHVRRVREVFAAANRARLPIVVHARTGDDYGAAQARVFVDKLLPAAPDIPVTIAHLWGGANFSADALAVYAEAVAAHRPATRRLYFDVTDAAYVATTPELAQTLVDRMRQIGIERIFYGSDAAFDNHPDPAASWAAFRKGMPLTAQELEQIATNVAPYLRSPD
jgi:predicted TIM-barrel fold metal-dependent hydrolase